MATLNWPEGLPLLEPRTLEIYDENIVRQIISRFAIPSDNTRRLLNSIDLATKYYLASIDLAEMNISVKESKKHLERIAKQSDELNKLLEKKPNPVWMALRNAEQSLIHELMQVENPTLESIGAARRIAGDSGDGFEFLTYWDAEAGVRLIQRIAELANDYIKEGKPGRRSNWGLDSWTHVLCGFWSRDLGREVTHWEHDGEPITEIGQFLITVMEPLAPSSIPSIRWSLSKHRTKMRQLEKTRAVPSPD